MLEVNSARSLHQILARLTDANETVALAWTKILGAEYGSAEFTVRHAEILAIYGDVAKIIETRLSAPQKDLYKRYMADWWRALVSPEINWRSGNDSAANVIGRSSLDLLLSLAENILVSQGDALILDDGETLLAEFRTACVDWLEDLDAAAFALPKDLNDEIKGQLRHLIWLIDNVDIVGAHRVKENIEVLTTKAATRTGEVKEEALPRWVQRIAAGIFVVSALSGFSQETADAAQTTANSITTIFEAANTIRHPGEVNSWHPKEITSGGPDKDAGSLNQNDTP